MSQEWADGQCSWANTAPVGPDAAATGVAQWRIAQVSPAHETLIVSTLCSQSNNPAEVGTKATFTVNGDSGDISPDFGASTYKHLELDFGQPMAGYADLTLDLTSPNGSITLDDITARFKRLPSALDNGPAGGVVGAYSPMGQAAVVADKPLPARRGRKIIHNAGVLLDYPRGIFCWSALRGIQDWSNAAGAEDYARNFPRRSMVIVRPRLLAQGGVYTVWVRVVPDATDTTEVHVFAGELGGFGPRAVAWGPSRASITVNADAGQVPVWQSTTITLPETRQAALPWPNAVIGFHPGPAAAPGDGFLGYTSAQVIGVSIWGA
ncbi:MAG: hypothetical protein EKK55_16390 [Rhodocyclaceae bacterium]|nr:MAG: hypothetical protein EKK55_16390 [Rhodocyclaceae bacterium]